MKIGINLGGVNYYTTDDPFIDRMRMAQAPNPIANNIPMPPVDPLTGFPLAAGQLNRQIGLDPASTTDPRNYVLLCDANVASVRTPWGTMIPKDGRATIRITSSAGGVGLGITATGPVAKFAFMRAEHEAAYLAGEVFNPEYIARVAPFPILRTLDWNATNFDVEAGVTSFPPRRPLPTDGYFSDDRGGIPAEYVAMLAKKTGATVWYPLHHLMPDFVIGEIAAIFAKAGVRVIFEFSNEFGWTYHRTWAFAQAAAKSITPTPTYADVLRWYGWRSGQLAKLVSSISPLFQVVLSSQASNGASNLPPILKGWDETASPRSLIAGYANNSYLNLNGILPALLAAMDANDKAGFLAAARTLLPALKARHVLAKKACDAAGTKLLVYEGGPSLYLRRVDLADDPRRAALLTFAGAIMHDAEMADIDMQIIQDAFDAGVETFCYFQLSGPGSQYGIWGTMPHITQAPYPIYDRLLAGIAGDKAVVTLTLDDRVTDIERRLKAAGIG
jgi:hypothetical protein